MKKTKLLLASILLVSNMWAFGSFDSFDSFGDDSSFGSSFGGLSEGTLEIGGRLNLENRIITPDDKSQSKIDLFLELSYARESSDFFTKIKINEDKEIEIDEAYIRLFYDNFIFDVGRIKNIWGKGDMIQPVDLMNGMDLSDLLERDYAERVIAEDMLKVTYRGEGEARYIFAWAPSFTPNKLETRDGHHFTPKSIQNMYDSNPNLSENMVENLFEVDNDIKYSQFALRHTNTKDGLDYGFTLYKGYDKTANIVVTGNTLNDIKINYTKIHALGGEFAKVVNGYNTRGEIVYIHTEDTSGNDPLVPNNRIETLLGFDRDLKLNNVNINVQLQTTYLLNASKAKDNLKHKGYDANTGFDGKVNTVQNMLVVKVSDKYKNDKIIPETKLTYEVEDRSFIFTNSVELQLKDDIKMDLGYVWIHGKEDSKFGQYKDSDYAFIKFEYNF